MTATSVTLNKSHRFSALSPLLCGEPRRAWACPRAPPSSGNLRESLREKEAGGLRTTASWLQLGPAPLWDSHPKGPLWNPVPVGFRQGGVCPRTFSHPPSPLPVHLPPSATSCTSCSRRVTEQETKGGLRAGAVQAECRDTFFLLQTFLISKRSASTNSLHSSNEVRRGCPRCLLE